MCTGLNKKNNGTGKAKQEAARVPSNRNKRRAIDNMIEPHGDLSLWDADCVSFNTSLIIFH